jgi:bifunctional UDP-N-acetylglucosamine pyrophosphorylase/glucosamine-1-phosphate N-acetyltransferase
VEVGPFSHIREGTLLEDSVHIGNYTEIKNSHLGKGTKSGHFSYLGDADIGTNVNIGAGTITCNYDGRDKHRTVIGDEAFIGCDTMLVAPINIGRRALTGTGSIVTKDVPADSKAIGSPARILRGGRS